MAVFTCLGGFIAGACVSSEADAFHHLPTSRGKQPALRGVGVAGGTRGQASDAALNLRLPQDTPTSVSAEISRQWQQIHLES